MVLNKFDVVKAAGFTLRHTHIVRIEICASTGEVSEILDALTSIQKKGDPTYESQSSEDCD